MTTTRDTEPDTTAAEPVDEQPTALDEPDEPDIAYVNDDDTGAGGAEIRGEPDEHDREGDESTEHEHGLTEAATPSATPEQLERLAKRAENRAKSYATFVAEVAAESGMPLMRCGACDTELNLPGYVLHPDVQEPTTEQTAWMHEYMGEPVAPRLLADTKSSACPRCDGWGQVLTGSRVHGENVAECTECHGRGWVGERANITPQQAGQTAARPVLAPVDGDETPADEDAWGTPVGHPDFGRLPQFRKPGWQDALEAYRRGEPAPIPVTAG